MQSSTFYYLSGIIGFSLALTLLVYPLATKGWEGGAGVGDATRRLLWAGIGLLGGIILAAAVLRAFRSAGRDRPFLAACLLVAAIYWLWISRWLWYKRHSGRQILDVGWRQSRKLLFAIGIAWCVLFGAIELAIATRDSQHLLRDVTYAATMFAIAIYLLSLWLSGLEIRERGILSLGGLIRWQQITSYRWEGRETPTLILSLSSRAPLLRSTSIAVAENDWQTVDRVLADHLQTGSAAAA